jgi:hypothetical protein
MHLLLNCTRAFRCEDCTTSARTPHLERLAIGEAPLCVLPQREIRVARLGKETILLQFTMMEPAYRTWEGSLVVQGGGFSAIQLNSFKAPDWWHLHDTDVQNLLFELLN